MSKLIIILILYLTDQAICLNVCEDWATYGDTKCIKVVEKRATHWDAVRECRALEPTAELVTIHDSDEQLFFNTLLLKYNTIANTAWIALKYRNDTFEWMDGSAEDYTNWSDDAVRDGKNECGVMSLDRVSIGKWLDDSCIRKALVVCQKRQVITFHVLKTAVDNITDTIQAQNGQIANQAKEVQILKGKTTYLTDQMARQYQLLVEQNDLVNGLKMKVEGGVGKLILPEPIFGQNNSTISATISALDRMVVSQANEILSLKKSLMESSRDNSQLRSELIPVGFIYTQLPDQAPPSLIWPRFLWTDITSDYAGQFFRAEGGNSSSFGTLQAEQSPRLMKVHKHPGEADLWGDVVVDLVPGEETKKLYTGGNSGNDVSLSFLMSKGEVRPVNKAIRIWKRTG